MFSTLVLDLLMLKSRIQAEFGKRQKEMLQKVYENALILFTFILEMMIIISLMLFSNKIYTTWNGLLHGIFSVLCSWVITVWKCKYPFGAPSLFTSNVITSIFYTGSSIYPSYLHIICITFLFLRNDYFEMLHFCQNKKLWIYIICAEHNYPKVTKVPILLRAQQCIVTSWYWIHRTNKLIRLYFLWNLLPKFCKLLLCFDTHCSGVCLLFGQSWMLMLSQMLFSLCN